MNCFRLSYQNWLILSFIVLSQFLWLQRVQADEALNSAEDSAIYGPENWLKTVPTPFTTAVPNESPNYYGDGSLGLKPIGIDSSSARNLLAQRFHGPKLYLPSRLMLGECAEFIFKGTPGYYAAIAMSESNKGAKPILGHKLRLGPDRKLVSLGQIPETGVLSLFVETPIQGDLVDSSLYFEGLIWRKADFSDLEFASTVLTSQENDKENGVLVAGQQEKKQRAVVFDGIKPMSTRNIGGVGSLSSGHP